MSSSKSMLPKGEPATYLNVSDSSETITAKALDIEFKVKIFKFIIALICLAFGIMLTLKGLNNNKSIVEFSIFGNDFKLNTSLPGVVLALFSVILMLFTKNNINISNSKK